MGLFGAGHSSEKYKVAEEKKDYKEATELNREYDKLSKEMDEAWNAFENFRRENFGLDQDEDNRIEDARKEYKENSSENKHSSNTFDFDINDTEDLLSYYHPILEEKWLRYDEKKLLEMYNKDKDRAITLKKEYHKLAERLGKAMNRYEDFKYEKLGTGQNKKKEEEKEA